MCVRPSSGGRAVACSSLATLFQRSGQAFLCSHRLPFQQVKVIDAISTCRTDEAGYHLQVCDTCGHAEIGFNSCRDRHCPTCQWIRQQEWVAARIARMLPVRHFHVVFTVPAELRPLAAYNPEVVYDRMQKAAAQTLVELAKDRLGIYLGVTVVLHTWTREMLRHPHVHCIVSAGGEDLVRGGWKPIDAPFLLPVDVMTSLFRGKLLGMLKATDREEPLQVPGGLPLRDLLRPLYKKSWVAYVKAPFKNRRRVVSYLGSYTRRVAISDGRVVHLGANDVTFRTRRRRTITLTDEQFIDRFRLHILPRGFRKVRHYGLYAPGSGVRLQQVVDSYVAQFGEPPPVPTTCRRGRQCPVCEHGILRFKDDSIKLRQLINST